jgi:hypothetical protein
LVLVKNGVPYDRAFAMEADELAAHVIVFGQLDGGEWDWSSMRWKERK